jgi:shikimate kinase
MTFQDLALRAPMILKLVRSPAIYLVGFMGSGKSTVGRLLADRLGWSFSDLDCEIETEQQTSIGELFDRHGEDYFRRLETEALRKKLRQVRTGRPIVVALGGGAFTRPENLGLLEGNGVSIWLDCPVESAWRRVQRNSDRPLARDGEQFRRLYETRRSSYAKADYRVEVRSDDPEITVEAICKLPIF